MLSKLGGILKIIFCLLLFYIYVSLLLLGVKYTSSLVTKFDNMVKDLPMREAVRYTNGNVKCTAEQLKVRNLPLCNGQVLFIQ